MTPLRLQRSRARGWRKPPGAIYVGRPTAWGNDYKIGAPHPAHGWPMSAQEATDLFERDLLASIERREHIALLRLRFLRGHDLLCWCGAGKPCHADIWLREANR